MEEPTLATFAARLTQLEHRVRWYRRLSLGLAGALLVGASLAAQPTPATVPLLRATRLEIVNAAGHVALAAEAGAGGGSLRLWSQTGQGGIGAYATEFGGRVEVSDNQGKEIFSAGTQSGTRLPGIWERERRTVVQQQRDQTQQQQALSQTTRQLRTLEQQSSGQGEIPRLALVVEQQRRDLDQQRRDIDQQRRLIEAVERQLRSLERR